MRIIIFVIALMGLLPSVVHAKGTDLEWDTLYREVIDLYRAGKNDHVIVFAQKATTSSL